MLRLTFAVSSLLMISSNSLAQWQGMKIEQMIPTDKRIYSLTLSHNNKDGVRDLIALPADPFNSVMIYRGSTESQFQFSASFNKDENYRVLESGDLDADGADDLVLSSYWGNGFKIYWSNADGTYTEGNYFGLTGHGKNLKLVDYDNDTDLDIIAFSGGSGQPITLHVFRNNKSRSITPAGIFGSALHTDKRITIIDKNKDGLLDVMVASSFPWFVIFYQQNDGKFVPRYWPYQLEFPFTSEYYLADLNNDSHEDIIANYFDEGIRFYEGKSDTLFNEQYVLYSPSFKAFQLFPVDLNKDGLTDLIAQHQDEEYNSTDSLYYIINKGNFTFEEPQLIQFPSRVEKVLVEDFNGDAFSDIVAYTSQHGIVTVLNEGLVTGLEDEIQLVSVTPNPFVNYLKVNAGHSDCRVDAYDSRGTLIESSFGKDFSLDTSTWPAGIFFVKIQRGRNVVTRKVVKQ